MRVKLDDRVVKKLLSVPESRMGYQRVDLRLADGRELREVVVFNAEEVDLPDSAARVGIADLRIHDR